MDPHLINTFLKLLSVIFASQAEVEGVIINPTKKELRLILTPLEAFEKKNNISVLKEYSQITDGAFGILLGLCAQDGFNTLKKHPYYLKQLSQKSISQQDVPYEKQYVLDEFLKYVNQFTQLNASESAIDKELNMVLEEYIGSKVMHPCLDPMIYYW